MKKKLIYESPKTTMDILQSEGTLLVGSGYTPENEIKGSITIKMASMRLQEGTDNGEDWSNYDSFKHSWEEE